MTIRQAMRWLIGQEELAKSKKMEYCDMCGRKLVNVIIPTGYDGYTGERQYVLYLKCPNLVDRGLAQARLDVSSEEKRCFLSITNDITLGWCTKDGRLLD